ncbi:MAG: hypothetical protein KC502_05270 [Myxococcales bacterium]|nr:hypothetical protein [Myxococcales bacterium]
MTTRLAALRLRSVFLSAVALSLAMTFAWAPAPAAAKGKRKRKFKTVLDFESRLKDENNKPVSGIFPMTFTLRRRKGRKRIWKERHWVAVNNGRYQLQLGRRKNLPRKFDPDKTLIEVAIDGAGTVLTQVVSGEVSQVVARPAGAGRRMVKYAEKAGFAYDSEHSTVSDRVGPYTGKLLKETINKLKKRKARIKLSRNRINLTSAGGVGGTPFEQICPPGTIMVGLRGGCGIYIDNVQVVCAPLE